VCAKEIESINHHVVFWVWIFGYSNFNACSDILFKVIDFCHNFLGGINWNIQGIGD